MALTVLVRAALLPLTLKQFKSMQNMAKFQPEIKKLQERYKGDRERLNQEMMKFYRENKVNPFASCLPLVAQLPVFLALFYMLQDDLRLDVCPDVNPPGTENPAPCGAGGAAQFLFIPDITDKATGGVLITLIVLYVGSQLLSTILMSTATDKTQRIIFLALPFVFVIFVINFPAGLLVYWITTNLWTIVQQVIVRKRLGPMRPAGPDGEAPPMSIMDRMLHGRGSPPTTGGLRRAGAGCERQVRQREVQQRRSRAAPRSRRRRAALPRRRHRRRARRRSAPGDADEPTRLARRPRPRSARARQRGARSSARASRSSRRATGSAASSTATTWASSSAATARPSTRSSTSRSRSPRTGSRRRPRSRSTRRATASAVARRSSARPTRRPSDALRSDRPVALDAMSATERKVVHEYLKDRDDVETYSEGTEPDRHLVVAPLHG